MVGDGLDVCLGCPRHSYRVCPLLRWTGSCGLICKLTLLWSPWQVSPCHPKYCSAVGSQPVPSPTLLHSTCYNWGNVSASASGPEMIVPTNSTRGKAIQRPAGETSDSIIIYVETNTLWYFLLKGFQIVLS